MSDDDLDDIAGGVRGRAEEIESFLNGIGNTYQEICQCLRPACGIFLNGVCPLCNHAIDIDLNMKDKGREGEHYFAERIFGHLNSGCKTYIKYAKKAMAYKKIAIFLLLG